MTLVSECLNKLGVGGSMNGILVNHMLYAGDICIISSGLQRLLNIFDDCC